MCGNFQSQNKKAEALEPFSVKDQRRVGGRRNLPPSFSDVFYYFQRSILDLLQILLKITSKFSVKFKSHIL